MKRLFLTGLMQTLLFFYLLLKKRYREEIGRNFFHLFGKKDNHFWWKNARALGKNLALMIIGRPLDKIETIGENISMGKGAIFLTCHFGLWEILPKIFKAKGYRVAIAVGRQRIPILEKILSRLRSREGIVIVDKIPEMISLLKRGFLLGFAGDNTRRVKRFYLPEIGKGFGVVKTPFLLAKRSGLPLYTCFSVLRGSLIQIEWQRISQIQDFATIARNYIQRYPEQWIFWGK